MIQKSFAQKTITRTTHYIWNISSNAKLHSLEGATPGWFICHLYEIDIQLNIDMRTGTERVSNIQLVILRRTKPTFMIKLTMMRREERKATKTDARCNKTWEFQNLGSYVVPFSNQLILLATPQKFPWNLLLQKGLLQTPQKFSV